MGAYPEYTKLMSFSNSSSDSLPSMSRRNDFRRDVNGYFAPETDAATEEGNGFGSRIAKGGELKESSKGR
jgi:hypothetical protein